MHCWKCNYTLDLGSKKLGFRALCDHCNSWLHVCVNCAHYHPGMPNDCDIPYTEYVADREKANFCEEFAIKIAGNEKRASFNDVASRLFDDSDDIQKKGDTRDTFNSLFSDD